MDRVVVVGGGLAAYRFAQAVREAGFGGAVTVISDEQHFPYDRPPLSKQLLAGAWTAEQCALPGDRPDVRWRHDAPAVGLDRDRRTVMLAGGGEESYDGLVIATGRRARPWPGPMPKSGVHTIRDLEDTAAFRRAVTTGTKLVIIGAGFIGCEVAATLRSEGVDVTVVDSAPHPMPVIGPEAGARAQKVHESHGVRFRLSAGVSAIEGDEHVTGVRLDGGELLPATVVLVAIGSLPNSEWLEGSGLAMRNGTVVCDTTCSVLDEEGNVVPEIMAAGDIASWQHPHSDGPACIEHWSNARDMGDLAAANLFLPPAERAPLAPMATVPTFWSDQFELKIKSAGYLRAADSWSIVSEDPAKSSLVVEARRGEDVVGAVAFNMNRSIIGYHRALGTAQ